MKGINRLIVIQELDKIFSAFGSVDRYEGKYGYGKQYRKEGRPDKGWLNFIRVSLNFPVKLLAAKVGKQFPQSIIEFEKGETEETISIGNLRKIGDAMGMELVYGFVSKDGETLESKIGAKLEGIAQKQFYDTPKEKREKGHPKDFSNNSAIAYTKRKIFKDFPKSIWD